MNTDPLSGVNGFFSKRDYGGADMEVVRRVTAVAAFLSAAVIAGLSPLAPPDDPLGGPAGWALLCVLAGGYLLLGLRLERMPDLRPDSALAVHYAGLAGLAVAVWLSEGRGSPYMTLFLIWMTLAAASHPPRRTVVLLAVAGGLALLPFLYDDWNTVFAADIALRVLVWSTLALLACIWTTRVRVQRANLIEDEEQAKRQARLDPLTGLGNRRAFDERVDRAIERARTGSEPLSVIIVDLDDFKEINDSYGHLNGDALLRDAAGAMRAAVRDQDACYRWGGDEFAVVLPGIEQEVAEKVAERISTSVLSACIRPSGEPQTLAWGSAELAPGMQASDLLASADLALMTRKHKKQRGGRFRAREPESEADLK